MHLLANAFILFLPAVVGSSDAICYPILPSNASTVMCVHLLVMLCHTILCHHHIDWLASAAHISILEKTVEDCCLFLLHGEVGWVLVVCL